jgi:flagellar assembly protein FliH
VAAVAGVLRREKFASVPPFSFPDVEGQARLIQERAEEQARETVAQAEEEARQRAARIEKEAHERGLQEGRREGLAQVRREATQAATDEARADLARLTQALETGLAAFEESRRRLLALAECGLIELALTIARRVCKRDVGTTSATALANARAVVQMAEHERDLEVHVNPAECAALQQAAPQLLASTKRLTHVKIVPDGEVERGGCVLHSRVGTIDASVETQLDRVAEALLERPA